MLVSTYLAFNGQCEAAFRFYEQCLSAKIVALVTYGETPLADQFPAEKHGSIAHARLSVGDAVLMGGDAPHDRYITPQGFCVALVVDSPAEADRLFAAFAEGGTVTMPIEKTFWASRFGMVTDRFGTPWMVSCENTP